MNPASFGPNPWHQQSWDWRAAGNFICGGVGSGLIVCAALFDAPRWLLALGAALVGLGLASVWLEIGRPWRALHVAFNPRTSWMSRESMLAPLLFVAVAAAWLDVSLAAYAAALFAAAFVTCQGFILRAAKGIPAWREPRIVPLIVTTALVEGAGLLLLLTAFAAAATAAQWALFALLLWARWLSWAPWRNRLRAAPRALAALDRAGLVFKVGTLLPLAGVVLAIGAPLPAEAARVLQALCGALALASGAWFKLALITRGAFNQGFALPHLPVRGVPRR
jgi:phenylacetyl-CoA:acceptor oxidoreductase subunit 2